MKTHKQKIKELESEVQTLQRLLNQTAIALHSKGLLTLQQSEYINKIRSQTLDVIGLVYNNTSDLNIKAQLSEARIKLKYA